MSKKKYSEIYRLISDTKKERKLLKKKLLKQKFECSHYNGGKHSFKRVSGTVVKCRECGTKIDFAVVETAQKDPNAFKKALKKRRNDMINDLNVLKVLMNPKNDSKHIKNISKLQFLLYYYSQVMKAGLVDGLVSHKGKKKNKKRGGNNHHVKTGFNPESVLR